MKISSNLYDSRIGANNVLVELTVKNYEELVKDVLERNEFQRKRVRSSKTVYALLKKDLLLQCVIPPIVLAITNNIDISDNDEALYNSLRNNKDHLVILDGLQRTHTIFELLSELRASEDDERLRLVEETVLRVEIYIGLNRLGILYRMLTLNTGQTPISLRQQIEMLYLDYLHCDINGVELLRESQGVVARGENQYYFNDVVQGFVAYLDRDALPIDKSDVLENINSLDKLSNENQQTNLFENYVIATHKLIRKAVELCGDSEISHEYIEANGPPFGKDANRVFKKRQAMSGFGAAIGMLIDHSVLEDIGEATGLIDKIHINNGESFLEEINDSLLWLKDNSKKIGNAQRAFFTYFFRELFNKDTDGYLDLTKAAKTALNKYKVQNT